MSEQETTLIPDDDGPIMPEGYEEDKDFFSDDWTADAPSEEPETKDSTPGPDPAAEAAGAAQAAQDIATTGEPAEPAPEPADTPRKLKFRTKVDHEDRDVELDEAELPAIYQKAQVADRWKDQKDKLSAFETRASALAKSMGYESADAMLSAASDSYRQQQIDELVSQGTPKLLAEDYIDRRMHDAQAAQTPPQPAPAEQAPVDKPAERDYRSEAEELFRQRPDLAGKQLPQEVLTAWVSGARLSEAFRGYEQNQKAADAEKLRRENAVLKQNAAAAAKAPVKGVTGGGQTDTEPEDPFLTGFNDERW